jgi:hypothetical protein
MLTAAVVAVLAATSVLGAQQVKARVTMNVQLVLVSAILRALVLYLILLYQA